MCGNNSCVSMFIFCQDKMYKTNWNHTIGICGFQTSIYNIYFTCFNARRVTLLLQCCWWFCPCRLPCLRFMFRPVGWFLFGHQVASEAVHVHVFWSFLFDGSKGGLWVRRVSSIHGSFYVYVSMLFCIFVHIFFGPVPLLPLPSAIRARRCAEPVVQFRGV